MLYRLAVVVLSSLLLAQNICADVSPNQVVVTIQAVTTVSQTLNTALVTVDKSTTVSQLSSVALVSFPDLSDAHNDILYLCRPLRMGFPKSLAVLQMPLQ